MTAVWPGATAIVQRRGAVARVACPSCKGANIGTPCLDEKGALVGGGACLFRMRAFTGFTTARRRDPNADYYASYSVAA